MSHIKLSTKSKKSWRRIPHRGKLHQQRWAKVISKQSEGYYGFFFFKSTTKLNLFWHESEHLKLFHKFSICCRVAASHCTIVTGVPVILSTPCTVYFQYQLSQEAEESPYWEGLKDRAMRSRCDLIKTTEAVIPDTFSWKALKLAKTGGKYPPITHAVPTDSVSCLTNSFTSKPDNITVCCLSPPDTPKTH